MRHSVRALNMKYTLEFVFIERYAMLFCQLRKWQHKHMLCNDVLSTQKMAACAHVGPLIQASAPSSSYIYNSMLKFTKDVNGKPWLVYNTYIYKRKKLVGHSTSQLISRKRWLQIPSFLLLQSIFCLFRPFSYHCKQKMSHVPDTQFCLFICVNTGPQSFCEPPPTPSHMK